MATGIDYANIKPSAGVTLTLAARIIASGASGVELNSAGTLLLTNPGNTFTGVIRLSVANGTISFSTPGALGSNAIRFEGSPSRCVYTGSGSATLGIPVQITAAGAIFENAGTGTLTLGGAIAPASNGAKTLTFAGTTQTNRVTGGISNGSGLLSVVAASGTLVLDGTVTDSTVTAGGGATLAVGASAVFQNSALTANAGSTVSLNPAASDGFAVTLPLTNILSSAGVRLVVPAAATTSTVTFPVLTRMTNATLDIAATELGTARNTLLVQNLSAGPLPTWFTVNGQPAAYSAALGVIPVTASGATRSLTALGPSVVPNDATAAAVIDAAGDSGGITLAADPTAVFSLTQNHAGDPATVDLGGQTLAATVVAVAAAGNSLTLTNGTLSTPTALTPPSGPAIFPTTLPTPPIAWFDLADAATVTFNAAGRISLLANKGSLGSALDAVAPADRIGPRYVPGSVNGLGVARADDVQPPQGLATLGNAGITGSAPRTAFIVASRSPVSLNSFYALYLGPDSGTYNQDFCICERTDRTSFVTKGSDLESSSASPVGHNVLTFTTGLGGTPNAGAAYRNGLLLGSKTFALATVNAPLRLLHRPVTASANSGPGEVAEVLVFNYTLSDPDRAAVEAYLMHKWRIAAQRDDALLALRNDNPAAALAVPAALTEAYGTTLSLTKYGPGGVTLSGPATFSGSLLINEGSLTFATPAGQATLLAAPVSGAGALLKTGPGALTLAQSGPYAGGTAVQAGTLFSGMNGSLGTGPVTLADGAALDIVNGPATAPPATGTAAIANPVSVAGTGPDGLGALRHSGGVAQQYAFKSVTLTGDAAVYSASRFDVRGGAFDFGGHSLTVNGTGEFSIVQSAISNVTAGTGVYVANGLMRFEQSDFLGSAANVASAASGAGVTLFQMTAPMLWSLQLADNAYFRVNNGGTDTNLNRWAGPVTLSSGTARLNALAGGSGSITGVIGGDGGLLKEGPGWFWLFNSANTYAGATAVTQGNLYAVSPGSLGAQAASALTVSGTGTFIARAASATSADGWSAADIASIAADTVFTTPGTTSLGLDTLYEDFVVSADLPYTGLQKFGPRKLTLTGAAPDLGALTVHNGELDFTGTGGHNLHAYSVTVGATSGSSTASVLRVAGATLRTDDNGYNRVGPTLTVASVANTRGVLHVGAGAALNGRLLVGDAAGATGAVYQTGGSVTNTSGTANEAALGVSGYGYYRLDGGIFASKGATQFARNNGATALFEQRGGAFVINPGVAPADGVVGDYYNGSFSTRGGVGVFLLSGGTCNLNTHSLTLGDWVNVNNYNDGTGVLTLENDAQAEMLQIILANRNGAPQAFVNLNGGSLTTPYFQKGGNNSNYNAVAAVNFNGGVLRVPTAGNAVSSLVRTSANNTPALLNVYAGGAVIETLGTDGGVSLDLPLRAPYGFGVSGVTLTAAGAGYLAPPVVLFTGGNGTGATAVAEINLDTGALTAIRVTSPGVNYTTAPTVTLRGGGFATAAAATATLGVSVSGGLTKLGPGTLNLTSTNTYSGPTVVSNGTLRLGAGGQTLTVLTPITIAGGTLDLAGSALTNNKPVVIESGRLVNGTVSALSFTKSGGGSATLAAAPIVASAEALFQSYVKSLAPVAWYDPSDAATVTLNGSGRVIALANKGTRGAALNAAPTASPNLSNPPLLATGAVSYAASGLPMLKVDANNTGLVSSENLGIIGASPRTVVAILTRESDTTSAFTCFGATATAQMWEVGDRADSSSTVIGGFDGYDLSMLPRPTSKIAHVLFTQLTTSKTSEAWRTGDGQNYNIKTVTGNFNTADSRFFIGNRIDASKTSARGEIGEILVFDRLLSSAEREQLMAMLQQKWATANGLAQPEGETVAVSVAAGTLRLAPGAEAIARLAPTVWYDPSDAASVTTNTAGRVTGIVNKGTRAAAMNAVVRSGYQGPLLVTGTNSYSAARKPMLKIDNHSPGTGLESAANTGISGTAPRTLVAVLSRDPTVEMADVAMGDQTAPRTLFEVTDRVGGNCFGNNSDDLSISPVLPAASANVYMMDTTATNLFTGWRSGGFPNKVSKTLGGNWATTNTKLCLGYRPTVHKDAYRGQIGEVLLFDRLLTETERADVEDYLVNKWVRPGADNPFSGVTFDVAAGATLDLGGARTNITVTGAGTLANGTLGAGFVISPAGDSAVGELALTGVTFAGATYRLTTIGNSSDRLLINGNLSALTVVPATGAEITGRTFVIATGAITQKPALSGFPDKFKLIQKGNDLLLTSERGTLISFR
jgi:autotransporter-associated beta strand protein